MAGKTYATPAEYIMLDRFADAIPHSAEGMPEPSAVLHGFMGFVPGRNERRASVER